MATISLTNFVCNAVGFHTLRRVAGECKFEKAIILWGCNKVPVEYYVATKMVNTHGLPYHHAYAGSVELLDFYNTVARTFFYIESKLHDRTTCFIMCNLLPPISAENLLKPGLNDILTYFADIYTKFPDLFTDGFEPPQFAHTSTDMTVVQVIELLTMIDAVSYKYQFKMTYCFTDPSKVRNSLNKLYGQWLDHHGITKQSELAGKLDALMNFYHEYQIDDKQNEVLDALLDKQYTHIVKYPFGLNDNDDIMEMRNFVNSLVRT